ncbi:MAG: preprotein translocase subunit SecE [Wolbachia endosymbiont of Fragariocoptes setiger]|nr:preprotein translocase subunit SecE [Wolbachia endosymbiont of Fragariocoptes setiger]
MLKSLHSLFLGIKQEVWKISWVKRREVFSSLFTILIVIILFSFFFSFVDFLSLCTIKTLFGIIYDL